MITERYGINMKINWKSLYQKEHFVKRLITVIVAVIVMGFALSWLVLVDMGTDPCTLMNLTISSRLGISLGNWQALFNSILFIIVIWKGRTYWLWYSRQYVPGWIFSGFLLLALETDRCRYLFCFQCG